MIKLSAVIITYNEERDIGRCLDSLSGIADDVVVVDSFSTDKTRDICLSKGARFVEHVFEGHIEQKNYAITQAKYPFVLSLDADEALSPELKASIMAVKKNKKYDGYTMNRLNYYCGQWLKHCGWYPDRKLRLWDSLKGQWGGDNPHDKFIMTKEAQTTHLKGDLLHYSFYTEEEHLQQIEKFSTIGAQTLYKKGVKADVFKRFMHPVARFVKAYIIKMGFLDGKKGFMVCKNSAYANYLKYSKLHRLHKYQSL